MDESQDALSITLGATEKASIGLSAIGKPIVARCYFLATHSGMVVFADVPNPDELAEWDKKPADTPAPPGALEAIIRQASSSGKDFLYGVFVDLEGIVAQEGTPGGIFIAQRLRLLSADEGAGIAGTVIGVPEIRGLNQDASKTNPAFAEAVVKIERRAEVATRVPKIPGKFVYSSRPANQQTFIHLRQSFTTATPHLIDALNPTIR